MDELEALFVTLGMKTDDASISASVKEMIKIVQSNLKSSIYGGKNGVITLPATIEGTFKNGKEINKEIKDAYAAIYEKAKQMADESVSLTLNDIKEFKEQINKFANKTAKYKSSDVIANVNNNLRQTLSSYQDFVNDLRKQASAVQKTQIKQEQKIKAQKRAKEKPASYYGITDEEVKDALAKEEARYTKLKARREKEIAELSAKLGYKPGSGLDAGKTSKHDAQASEFSEYASNWARALAKAIKETYSTELTKRFIDKNFQEGPKGALSRATTKEEFLNDLSKKASEELTNLIRKSEKGKSEVTFDQIVDAIGVMRTIYEENGKDMQTIVKAITNATQRVYDHTVSQRVGGTGREEGVEKGVGPGHEKTQALLLATNKLTKKMLGEVEGLNKQEIQANKLAQTIVKNQYDAYKEKAKISDSSKDTRALAQEIKNTTNATKESTNATKDQMINDRVENTAERIADREAGKKSQELIKTSREDLSSGFNTDIKADIMIDTLKNILSVVTNILSKIGSDSKGYKSLELPEATIKNVRELAKSLKNATNLTDEQKLQLLANVSNASKTARKTTKTEEKLLLGEPEKDSSTEKQTKEMGKFPRSEIVTSVKDPAKLLVRLKDKFADLIGVTAEYKKVISATSDEQDKISAKRIKEYGVSMGRDATGDKIRVARSMSLWRGMDKFRELFKDLRVSEGIKIDTTEVTDKLGKVLSGKAMRNAQMGGSPLRNLLGYGTGFIGMPSLEKSRAAAEALSQINANIREAMNNTLNDIQDKESALAGMLETGDLKLDKEGNVLEGSTEEAKTLAVQLENTKLILASILADMGMVNNAIDKSHGNISKIMKQISFTSPELRKNNAIINNINAGYDKGGKALKFQTRTAEILNYTFQLMSRHIGQILKSVATKMLSLLNPLTYIKKAFASFSSYDTKWQRTMNVIKYNMRTIIRPFMEWLAQKLVNIIGFFDIISMKIQEAFGKIPISVFNQAAAQSEKIHEELEAGANVTAGFDELHDIGSDNTGANDLLGDIYKPQLSENWKELANKIGDLFKGLIKGDLGFGDVAKKILEILGQLLSNIASDIWEWFKKTAIGKWITDNWKKILDKVLQIFVGWKLLKVAGSLIANALFGTSSSGLLGKLGSSLMTGLTSLWKSGGLIGVVKAGGASLGTILGGALAAAAGVAISVAGISYFGGKADKNSAYNIGLMDAGGKESDKKSNLGNVLGATLTGAGGGALAGLAIGGPVGAAIGAGIGAIAGLLRTTLSPVLQQVEVDARNMNNEMQKIEYYEGQVQGATTQVDIFDEQLQLLKQSLDISTQSVYEQGEKLGISKTRMDELVKATQDGTFNTSMLTGAEVELSGSLTNLAEKQAHVTEVSEKLEAAQKKLLKAQTDLSIAQDVEAGNFEIAAARIEVAEEQGVYATEEATKKRIQLYKEGGEEERKNLLQNLTADQRTRMLEYNAETEKELGELSKLFNKSSKEVQEALLKGVGEETQQKFKQEMNSMDAIIAQHTSAWQKIGDTLAEAFSAISGIKIDTWTYNKEDKYYKEAAKQIKKDPERANLYDDATIEELKRRGLIPKYALGTNYVPNDGLAYLHQGEAVIPKKYNQPFSMDNSNLENAVYTLAKQVEQIGNKVDQGINIKGQFVQKGSDLVATVQKANNKLSNNILNNKVYAR